MSRYDEQDAMDGWLAEREREQAEAFGGGSSAPRCQHCLVELETGDECAECRQAGEVAS